MRIISGRPIPPTDRTLPDRLDRVAAEWPRRVAFRTPQEDGPDRTRTWAEVAADTRMLAGGLARHGIAPGTAVGILADPSGEWMTAAWAIMRRGATVVPIYPTLTAEQAAYNLNDAGVVMLFYDRDQTGKLAEIRERAPTIRHFVPMQDDETALADDILPYHELSRHSTSNENLATPDAISTLIYTSGTTGIPKGAELTHRNWCAALEAAVQHLHLPDLEDPSIVVFLPLAHVAGLLAVLGPADVGGTITWSNPKRLAIDLARTRPSVFGSVPRIYERIWQRVRDTMVDAPPLRRRIYDAAEATALAVGANVGAGKGRGLGLRLRHALFERLVYRKLRDRVGFDQLRIGLAGAAATRPDVIHFYQGIGVPLVEGYGLTESTGLAISSHPHRFRSGSVGLPIPGVELALDDDGEILLAGDQIFRGYHNRPDENAATFLEADGRRWLRTGDIGALDDDGHLHIIDRKKELEVLDTGKKIAPVTVETVLRQTSDLVADSVLIGTGRKYVAALILPDLDRLVRWAQQEDGIHFDATRLVVRPDPTGAPMTYAVGDDLVRHPRVEALYADIIERVNTRLADFERIRAFRLLPHAFTIDRDELTPSLKKKRRVITAHYQALIDEMFARERGT